MDSRRRVRTDIYAPRAGPVRDLHRPSRLSTRSRWRSEAAARHGRSRRPRPSSAISTRRSSASSCGAWTRTRKSGRARRWPSRRRCPAAIRSPRRWRPAKRRRPRCWSPPAKVRRWALDADSRPSHSSRSARSRSRLSRRGSTITGRVPLDKPPAVLADRVQQFLKSVGYTEPVADSASGLAIARTFLRWLPTVDQRPQRWDILNTGSPWALVFWHRTSPRPLVTSRTQIQVTATDPPMTVSGMTLVIVDTLGRVVEFQVVPSQFDSTPPRHRRRRGRSSSTPPV